MTRSVSPKKHLDEGKPTFPIPDPILELQTQFLGQVSKVGLISIKRRSLAQAKTRIRAESSSFTLISARICRCWPTLN